MHCRSSGVRLPARAEPHGQVLCVCDALPRLRRGRGCVGKERFRDRFLEGLRRDRDPCRRSQHREYCSGGRRSFRFCALACFLPRLWSCCRVAGSDPCDSSSSRETRRRRCLKNPYGPRLDRDPKRRAEFREYGWSGGRSFRFRVLARLLRRLVWSCWRVVGSDHSDGRSIHERPTGKCVRNPQALRLDRDPNRHPEHCEYGRSCVRGFRCKILAGFLLLLACSRWRVVGYDHSDRRTLRERQKRNRLKSPRRSRRWGPGGGHNGPRKFCHHRGHVSIARFASNARDQCGGGHRRRAALRLPARPRPHGQGLPVCRAARVAAPGLSGAR